MPYVGPFDGFHAVPASVSKTCLVRFDKNRYSVEALAVSRPVEIRAYAERVEFWQEGQLVGRHPRAFASNKAVYDPLHYIAGGPTWWSTRGGSESKVSGGTRP